MKATIDFHTHYIPRSMSAFHADGCVRLDVETPTCGHLYNGQRLYRTIDDRCWNVQHRLSDMDEREISLQVLSPIPITNAYSSNARDGLAFAHLHNIGIAEIVRLCPGRFAGLGAVPLQDVDAACTELHALVRDMGLLGIEIGTTVGSHELDDDIFLPFWEECNALKAVVFIHPETAPGFDRHRKYGIVGSAAYPSETGIVAAKLLMGGYLERFPDLTIVLAHGGGTLPWLLPRMDRFWEKMPSARSTLQARPSLAARGFYCDTLTFDGTNLNLVGERIGFDRLLVGSDYPFGVMEDPPGAVLEQLDLDERTEMLLRGGNFQSLAERSPVHRRH